ncbi:uncharacterized protein [Bemisia tabaci]|uniref:uncharacterized protein n=1 Tax=Bemisia tabaci TaxID=7038 RepID=UPI003B27F841
MPSGFIFLVILLAVIPGQIVSELTKLRIREGSKVFMRVTLKLNTIPSTRIFASAIGYRVNWDILPVKKKKKKATRKEYLLPYAQHVHLRKRDVHATISNILNRHGFNGSSCVLRASCESSLFNPYDVKTQLFSILFPPIQRNSCDQPFDDCPLSLLHILTHGNN